MLLAEPFRSIWMIVGSNHLVCLDHPELCVIYRSRSTHMQRWWQSDPIWRNQSMKCRIKKLLAALPTRKKFSGTLWFQILFFYLKHRSSCWSKNSSVCFFQRLASHSQKMVEYAAQFRLTNPSFYQLWQIFRQPAYPLILLHAVLVILKSKISPQSQFL
jgi:hypothetical protein